MNAARFRLPRAAGPRSLVLAAGVAVALTPREQEKLPIYPQPDPEIIVQEVPSELERQIGIARKSLTATYRQAHQHVQDLVSKWIGVEHAVEHRVKAIISPEESLTPGILYVGVATLSGSIIARNRALPIRFITPPVLLALSMNHFLPKTTANLSEYLGNLEETYFPTLAQKHAVANAHTAMTWEMIKNATANGRESVTKGVENAVGKIEETTGLKLKETLGLGKELSKQAEGRVLQAVKAAEVKFEETKAASEAKVAEGKAIVEAKTAEIKAAADKKVEEFTEKLEKKTEEPPKRLV
ncbi:hypothetical protein VNI00_007112 [Paramarasmius palmivorus]|uniref:MICOS complex subunit n=1 Tax=Paramarasmius palmivorus TaxID=297713 RepID=A0AAW0D5J1_9AGAR